MEKERNSEDLVSKFTPFTRERTPAEQFEDANIDDLKLLANGLAMQLEVAEEAISQGEDRTNVREGLEMYGSISRVVSLLDALMPLDRSSWRVELNKRLDHEHPDRQRHEMLQQYKVDPA